MDKQLIAGTTRKDGTKVKPYLRLKRSGYDKGFQRGFQEGRTQTLEKVKEKFEELWKQNIFYVDRFRKFLSKLEDDEVKDG